MKLVTVLKKAMMAKNCQFSWISQVSFKSQLVARKIRKKVRKKNIFFIKFRDLYDIGTEDHDDLMIVTYIDIDIHPCSYD